MPNFTYTNNIPLGSHNPSVDQPDMQINTNSIDDIIEVDHYSFNNNDGGYHKIIHQLSEISDPVAIPNVGQFYPKTLDNEINPYYLSGTGTKYNIVNKSGSGLINITTVPSPSVIPDIIPDNCIGFIIFTNPSYPTGESIQSFSFSAFSGVLYTQLPTLYNVPAATSIAIGSTGAAGSLQITVAKNIPVGPDIINSAYRYILWPLT